MDLSQITVSLKNDDNVALRYIYVEYGNYCIKKIRHKRNCSEEEAEDLFIESVMIFREKILNGSIEKLISTKNYLYQICENRYLASLKQAKSRAKKLSDIQQFYYSSGYTENSAHDGEILIDIELADATRHAWEQLSERCKDIICYFYVDSLKMEEIADLMGLANADVAKTTKSRCYKHFVDIARKFYNASKEMYAK